MRAPRGPLSYSTVSLIKRPVVSEPSNCTCCARHLDCPNTAPHPNRSPHLAPLGGCSDGPALHILPRTLHVVCSRTRPWLDGPCANHMYWPAAPYLSPAAAEVSSRGWPPRAMAARARSSFAVTFAVELSGVVTVDITGVVATPALEGVSGVMEERPRRRFFHRSISPGLGVARVADATGSESISVEVAGWASSLKPGGEGGGGS